jgi:hypothetical protein
VKNMKIAAEEMILVVITKTKHNRIMYEVNPSVMFFTLSIRTMCAYAQTKKAGTTYYSRLSTVLICSALIRLDVSIHDALGH